MRCEKSQLCRPLHSVFCEDEKPSRGLLTPLQTLTVFLFVKLSWLPHSRIMSGSCGDEMMSVWAVRRSPLCAKGDLFAHRIMPRGTVHF
uniref:Uncharacterized protein n=1 Tax=Knipowitschia caucasica TaxID=637954 RepID=A0AAV2JA72_KNICA